jgi:microcystin-dependent protein
MALPFYNWSRTAASNATADSTVNWAEGMAPSAVNDSARAMMASAAAFRDDIAGYIVTGGTSTAYTVTSYQVFDSYAHMNKQVIGFTPHATSGGTCTLNVDGLGAKPLRLQPGVEIPASSLISGTPYLATYFDGDSAFYIHNFVNNPYIIPIGGLMDFIGSSAPSSSFVLPIGQAISRTTYATLFGIVGTTYGVGDGSTTFNVPDLTGRITAMKEASATRLTSTYFGGNSTSLGAVGGGESTTLTLAQLPTGITSSGSNSISVNSTQPTVQNANLGINPGAASATAVWFGGTSGTLTSTGSNSIAVTSNNTSGNPHRTVPPTIILNKILRII